MDSTRSRVVVRSLAPRWHNVLTLIGIVWFAAACTDPKPATPASSTKPVDIPSLGTDVATLAAGRTANHTCAILKDGTLRCWGQNLYGQIGDGVPISSFPAYVVGFGP